MAYALKPPDWQLPLSTLSESTPIYPQFYPTREGQEEDDLNESNVKTGFTGKSIVQTETFSAHQLIYDKLKGDAILPALSVLANAVAERRKSTRIPTIPSTSFRLPSRVTANQSKKDAWLIELMNPNRALAEISKNVPHGYKGEKLLEMIFVKKIPLNRAIWYIRINGATEIQNQRTRPTFSVIGYTHEWTLMVLEFVQKQLIEIVIPDSIPSSTTVKVRGVKSMIDSDFRESWITKFSFSKRLLEVLLEEQLLEPEALLIFLIRWIGISNLAQLPFVLVLTEEYLSEFLSSEVLSARLVSNCLNRLFEIEGAQVGESTAGCSKIIVAILRSIFISLPDAFIADPIWTHHFEKLEAILLDASAASSKDIAILQSTIQTDLADVNSRRETFTTLNSINSFEPQEIEIISLLDAEIHFPNSLEGLNRKLFHNRKFKKSLVLELPTLFNWAISENRYGVYRIYAVASIIQQELAEPSVSDKNKIDLEAGFIKWIDQESPTDTERIKLLLAELIRIRVLSYSVYLHRMIARGETEERISKPSLHLILLRSVPIFDESGSPGPKRRNALPSTTAERVNLAKFLDQIYSELESLIPGLIDRSRFATPATENCEELFEILNRLVTVGSQLTITRKMIPTGVYLLLKTTGASFSIEQNAILAQVYLVVQDFWGLFAYIVIILQSLPPRSLLLAILDLVERHLDVWTSLAVLPELCSALFSAHESLKTNGINDRRLIKLLFQFGQAGHLPLVFASFEEGHNTLMLSLSSGAIQPLPLASNLAELQSIIINNSPSSIAQVATTLWYRYHSYENWGLVLLETCIRLLSSVPVVVIANLLREINERLTTNLDAHLVKLTANFSPIELITLFHSNSNFTALLQNLILDKTLSGSNVLRSVILPTLSIILKNFPDQIIPTKNIYHLISSILGQELSEKITPSNLVTAHTDSSRRATFFSRKTLPDIGRCIALILLQQAVYVETKELEMMDISTRLLREICDCTSFKKVVAQEPDSLAGAMLDNNYGSQTKELNRACVLAGLLVCLKNGSGDTPSNLVSNDGWDKFLSGLTVWRLSIAKIEVSACLEGLDLDEKLSIAEKASKLHALAQHFLDRVCLGDGHTYLGEQVVKCFNGRASDELSSVSIARLALAINGLEMTASPELRLASLTTFRCTGRLLNTLFQSTKAASRAEPLDSLLTSVKLYLDKILEGDNNSDLSKYYIPAVRISQVLEIALRCIPEVPTSATLVLIRDCVSPIAKLSLVFAISSNPDLLQATLLLDTVSRLLFALSALSSTLSLPTLKSILPTSNQHLIPDQIFSRITQLLTPTSNRICPTNPWDMMDQIDPGPKTNTFKNSGPIDLNLLGARVIDLIPNVTAFNAPSPHSSSTNRSSMPIYERGNQTNFDSETACVGLSILAKDYRRNLGAESSPKSISTYDPAISLRNRKKKEIQEAILIDSPLSSLSPASIPETNRGTKRKEPEIVVISDDEVPAAKRGRAPPARRTTAGKTTGKTTAAKTTRGGAKKKR